MSRMAGGVICADVSVLLVYWNLALSSRKVLSDGGSSLLLVVACFPLRRTFLM